MEATRAVNAEILTTLKNIGRIIGVEVMPRSKSYQSDLINALKDPLEAQEYLNAALEDGNPEVFLLALRDVAEARLGGIKQLADVTKLNRESLYRMLSEKGNPELNSLNVILSTLGFRLALRATDVNASWSC